MQPLALAPSPVLGRHLLDRSPLIRAGLRLRQGAAAARSWLLVDAAVPESGTWLQARPGRRILTMAEALCGDQPAGLLQQIALLALGEPGGFLWQGRMVTAETVARDPQIWARLGQLLGPGGTLLVLASEAGAGAAGALLQTALEAALRQASAAGPRVVLATRPVGPAWCGGSFHLSDAPAVLSQGEAEACPDLLTLLPIDRAAFVA